MYMYNCITFPHSCHPHSGTCLMVTPAFATSHQRTTSPAILSDVYSINKLPVGSEMLVCQSDIHLAEKTITAWHHISAAGKILKLPSVG